jgi:CDP-diglyceride synthetase
MLPIRLPIIALKNLVNPVLVSLTVVAVWFYLGRFEESYVMLLVLTFLLVVQLINGVDFESYNQIFWKKTVVDFVLQWFWVISILLLIGFASNKAADYFSR